jgi:hypothetical protein
LNKLPVGRIGDGHGRPGNSPENENGAGESGAIPQAWLAMRVARAILQRPAGACTGEAVEKRPTEVGHERVRIRTGSKLYHKPHREAFPQYQCRHLRRINLTSTFDQSGKYPDSNAQESPGQLFPPSCAPFPASGQHRNSR